MLLATLLSCHGLCWGERCYTMISSGMHSGNGIPVSFLHLQFALLQYSVGKNTSVAYKETLRGPEILGIQWHRKQIKTKSTVLRLASFPYVQYMLFHTRVHTRADLTCSARVMQLGGGIKRHLDTHENILIKTFQFGSGCFKTLAEASVSLVPPRCLACLMKTILSLHF